MSFTYFDGKTTQIATDHVNESGRTFVGSGSKDKVNFNSGSGNTITVKSGRDVPEGISVTGNLKNSKVYGAGGNDYVNLLGTDNEIHGGDGNDNITGTGNLYGDDGDDVITASGNIEGGKGDDVISTSSCHSHNNIYYANGDGNDVFASHSDNDTIHLSRVSLKDVSYSNGLSFNLNSGNTIKINDADHKFIHITPDGGTVGTYALNGRTVVKAVNNFDKGSVSDPTGIDFMFNGGSRAKVDALEGNDFIYNSDKAPFATINGGKGDDTIDDHSAAAMIAYSPGDGNDFIKFDDTLQFYGDYTAFDDEVTDLSLGLTGRDNVTHYYGGGLLAIEGKISSDNYSADGATFNINGQTVKVDSKCFTVREKDGDGFKYTRYWNGEKYNSYVYRDDDREVSSTADGSVANGRGNYDNPAWSTAYANKSSLDFTEEADYIYTNFGTNKIFNALGGNDYIKNWGATSSTINAGSGNDTVFNDHYNYTSTVTIDAAEDDDYVKNNSSRVSIVGGNGKDTIYNYGGEYVTINGDDDNDYIVSTGAKNTISGGQGKDSIWNYSSTGPASIDGGTEDDYIQNYSSYSTITGGESGNDTIYNYSSTGSAVIDGGDGNNRINNYSSKSTISAAEGNDTVYNYSSIGSARIDVGDGNNFVYNNSSASTITAGKGKDTVYNNSTKGRASIDTGDGHDYIENNSYHATLTGGAGNDTIIDKTANSMVNYNPGDGSDVITFTTTNDYKGSDNLTHYYGGGLIAINAGAKHSYGKYSADTHTINVGGQKLTVNTNCFTVREGTNTDNYKYTRYWAENWTGKGITVKKFNSFVFLNDTHNEDTIGTYDDPNSADKYKSSSIINLTKEDDYLYANFGTNKIFNALEGTDYIVNYGATKSTIKGGAGNDTIKNLNGSTLQKHSCLEGKTTSLVTINGGTGNDSVYNESTNVSIFGAEDNDTVCNIGATVTIDGGLNDDSINNKGTYSSVVGGAGKDTVFNSGYRVTIDSDHVGDNSVSGVGYEDSVYNSGASVSIDSGYANDTIYSTGTHVTINSGVGDDLITNWGSFGSIAGGDGKDTIYSHGARANINSGKDDDIVYNYSLEGPAYINAGNGHNYVFNNSTQSTILAEDGNDTIYNNSKQTSQYIGGTTIKAGEGENFIENHAFKSTITSGAGNDTVYNYSHEGSARIEVGDGTNYVENYASQATITAGEGDDVILNRSRFGPASINSGAGNDHIENNASNVTIISGEGDDRIYNYATLGETSIDAGAGTDFAYIEKGDHLTFNGGAGDDIVTLNSTNHNNTVFFNAGDGNDTVYGWEKLSGNDYRIFDETGKKELMLGQDFATYAIGNNRRDLFVKLYEDRGSVLFVDVLEPVPPFDSLLAVTVDNKTELNDKIALKDTKPNFYNLNKETKVFGDTGDKVTIDGDYNALILRPDGSTVTVGSADDKVTLRKANDPAVYTYDKFSSLSAATGIVTVGAGVGTVIGSGWKSIGARTFDEIKGIKLKETLRSEILTEDIKTITRTDGITIRGNNADNWIVGGKGNDSLAGEEGDDTIEGGAGNDSVSGHLKVLDEKGRVLYESNDNNTFVVRAYEPKAPYSGGHVNQTTIVDYKENDDIKLAAGHIAFGAVGKSSKSVAGTVTFTVVNDGTNHNKAAIRVVEGYGKKINVINADNTHCAQVYGVKSITVGAADGETINTLWNPTVETIDGSNRQTSVGLIGNKLSNVIISGGGDNTIETGSGKDIIVYTEGNDIITDYEERKDVINLHRNLVIDTMETVTGADANTQDLIFNLNNGGSLRVNNAVKLVNKRGKTVENAAKICFVTDKFHTIMSADGEVSVMLNESVLRDGDTIDISELSPVISQIDASKLKKKISLNIIGKGGIKGGKGNDTITGSDGDDALSGGAGADIFVYTGGNDIIADYTPLGNKMKGDRIQLSEGQKIVSATMQGSNVILTVGDGENNTVGTIQINKCKNKEITVDDKTYIFGKGNATVKMQNGGSMTDIDEFVAVVDGSKSKTPVEIAGNDQNNIFKGGNGNDSLNGGNGNDSLNGGNGNDSLNGANGTDSLNGANGNDWLGGGAGNDTLNGGKGNDIFVYTGGDDVITDYSPFMTKNNGDIIKLADGLKVLEVLIPSRKQDVTFTIADENDKEVGTLLLKKCKGKAVTINGNTRAYSESETLASDVKEAPDTENQIASALPATDMWFMPENDFAVDDLNSIIKETSVAFDNAIGQLDGFNVDVLASKKNSLLTFNRKKG